MAKRIDGAAKVSSKGKKKETYGNAKTMIKKAGGKKK